MKILVAGAGAGKTTKMAKMVLDRFEEVRNGKIIYVITYTNAARDRIRESIIELHGAIPKQIKVETSHVFLLREIIFPFHHLLYDNYYATVSHLKLPSNNAFKAKKIEELKKEKVIHVEKVSQTAKWVICKKSRDNKLIKTNREKVILIINKYLDSVFIDEAQDIDKDFSDVIQKLDGCGLIFFLIGDPKQDLRGRNAFRKLVNENRQLVEYKTENHRCPVSHVKMANLYVPKKEKQIEQTYDEGELEFFLESETDVEEIIADNKWDHIFINKKNERFITHSDDLHKFENHLSYELKILVKKSGVNEKYINMETYSIFKNILKSVKQKTNWQIFKWLEQYLDFKLSKKDMGRLWEPIDNIRYEKRSVDGIVVQSIDKVKGLEGNSVLFILTADLAPYLFKENVEQNKMLNYLYVALTRAKQKLAILVTMEVEEKYGKKVVEEKIMRLFSV